MFLLVHRIKSVAQLPQIIQKLLRHILHSATLALSRVEHRNGVVHKIQLFLDLHARERWNMGSQQPLNRTIDWQGRNGVFLLVILELGEPLRRRLAQRRRLVYDEGLVVFLEIVGSDVLGRGDMDAHGDCIDQSVEGFDVGKLVSRAASLLTISAHQFWIASSLRTALLEFRPELCVK